MSWARGVASFGRPWGSRPVERCLACEAVVSKGFGVAYLISGRALSRLFCFLTEKSEAVPWGGGPFGLASEAALHGSRTPRPTLARRSTTSSYPDVFCSVP